MGSGPALFANACRLGLEGTLAKRGASSYRAGRGRDWLKIPLEWDELSRKLLPNHFNLRNVRRRLEKLKHDPFERMLRLEQRLPTEGIEP